MHHALIYMRMQLRSVAAFLFVSLVSLHSTPALATGFTEPGGESYQTDDGTVSLVWGESESGGAANRVFEVRRWMSGSSLEGQLVYEGQDTASFVSGLNEGEYSFRIRSKPEGGTYPEWGDESLSVTVDYIDMAIVWPLMAAGAVCFVVLILTIVFGRRAVAGKESA
ncbi:fibronectin type III domain-containing protein [Pelagicoccus sp. NFK12]|uniref:Fibronectin type III domain-containing protein n=1 Tax=Pelagicoccus enzymogenes TaxID=2773457 RepID=A0A927FCP2_9BACT|nr:fibronectin type III domain-containing protein [Pelagicoccus enzymogenes]MBD5781280.1 fibronectin type III domain-containing protein [Pelagicoccus enzymogenes]